MSTQEPRDDFAARATEGRTGLASELWGFLGETKKWWLAPIIVVTLVLGLIVVLGGSAAAPFIYTIF